MTQTERRVSPKEVAKLYARAEMLAKLPLSAQRWIVAHAGGDPYVGFVVEPYCLFLAYEIDDLAAARMQLPANYELVPTTMFAGGEPRYCSILGAFNVHSSVFWGSRVELYLIAENTTDGHALLGHLRLRVQHDQLRPRRGVLRRHHEPCGHHDVARRGRARGRAGARSGSTT